jgi:hypothetical protein
VPISRKPAAFSRVCPFFIARAFIREKSLLDRTIVILKTALKAKKGDRA